jgi:hypothetical protein
MMVTMPVIPVDVDVLGLLNDPILARCGRMGRCSLSGRAGEHESNGYAGQLKHPSV